MITKVTRFKLVADSALLSRADGRLGPGLFHLVELFKILDEVDTVELAMLVDHVVAL